MPTLERFIAVGDNHGDLVDEKVAEVMFDFKRSFRPTVRIHAGDCWNFAAFRRGATEQEQRSELKPDIVAGKDYMRRFNPTVFLAGNHDQRLWDLCKSDDKKLALAGEKILEDILPTFKKAQFYEYNKTTGIHRYGDTNFLHGYCHGIYAAKACAAAYGKSAMWHVHAPDMASVARIDGAVGYTSGCQCTLEQDYNRSHISTLRQNHGFIYGFKLPNNTLQIFQAFPKDGNWLFPTEFRYVPAT